MAAPIGKGNKSRSYVWIRSKNGKRKEDPKEATVTGQTAQNATVAAGTGTGAKAKVGDLCHIN